MVASPARAGDAAVSRTVRINARIMEPSITDRAADFEPAALTTRRV